MQATPRHSQFSYNLRAAGGQRQMLWAGRRDPLRMAGLLTHLMEGATCVDGTFPPRSKSECVTSYMEYIAAVDGASMTCSLGGGGCGPLDCSSSSSKLGMVRSFKTLTFILMAALQGLPGKGCLAERWMWSAMILAWA